MLGMENHMNLSDNSEIEITAQFKPGAFLAQEREKRGVSISNFANKLNLREQVLRHLEADEYHSLPEPVFVQGYIRAYCKYLEIPGVDELIAAYHAVQPPVAETKFDKHVWMKPEPSTQKTEKWLYRMTMSFVAVAIVSVGLWWFQNKGNDDLIPQQFKTAAVKNMQEDELNEKNDVKITDISKMRQILSNQVEVQSGNMSTME